MLPMMPRRRRKPQKERRPLMPPPDPVAEAARERRRWETRPEDWRYFVRGGAGLLLLVGAVVAIVRLIFQAPLDEVVMVTSLAVTVFGVGRQWFGTVHIARYVDRLRFEHGLPSHPVSRRTVLTGTVAITALALLVWTAVLLGGPASDAGALGRAAALGLPLALATTGLLYLLGRGNRAFIERPEFTERILADGGARAR